MFIIWILYYQSLRFLIKVGRIRKLVSIPRIFGMFVNQQLQSHLPNLKFPVQQLEWFYRWIISEYQRLIIFYSHFYFNNSGRLWNVKISFAIWSYSIRFFRTILAASKSDLATEISSFSFKLFWSNSHRLRLNIFLDVLPICWHRELICDQSRSNDLRIAKFLSNWNSSCSLSRTSPSVLRGKWIKRENSLLTNSLTLWIKASLIFFWLSFHRLKASSSTRYLY